MHLVFVVSTVVAVLALGVLAIPPPLSDGSSSTASPECITRVATIAATATDGDGHPPTTTTTTAVECRPRHPHQLPNKAVPRGDSGTTTFARPSVLPPNPLGPALSVSRLTPNPLSPLRSHPALIPMPSGVPSAAPPMVRRAPAEGTPPDCTFTVVYAAFAHRLTGSVLTVWTAEPTTTTEYVDCGGCTNLAYLTLPGGPGPAVHFPTTVTATEPPTRTTYACGTPPDVAPGLPVSTG